MYTLQPWGRRSENIPEGTSMDLLLPQQRDWQPDENFKDLVWFQGGSKFHPISQQSNLRDLEKADNWLLQLLITDDMFLV